MVCAKDEDEDIYVVPLDSVLAQIQALLAADSVTIAAFEWETCRWNLPTSEAEHNQLAADADRGDILGHPQAPNNSTAAFASTGRVRKEGETPKSHPAADLDEGDGGKTDIRIPNLAEARLSSPRSSLAEPSAAKALMLEIVPYAGEAIKVEAEYDAQTTWNVMSRSLLEELGYDTQPTTCEKSLDQKRKGCRYGRHEHLETRILPQGSRETLLLTFCILGETTRPLIRLGSEVNLNKFSEPGKLNH